MKKIYILCLAGLTLASTANAARFKSKRGQTSRAKVELKAPESSALWRPLSMVESVNEDGEVYETSFTYKYDARGNVIQEDFESEEGVGRTLFTYDEFNQVLTRVEYEENEEGDMEPVAKRVYQYDSKVPSFFTSRMGYDWDGADWVPNFYCETNEITRNALGNVLEVKKSLPLGEELLPAYLMRWTYGSDGTADTYEYFSYDAYLDGGDPWVLEDDISIRDIKWDRTDGQMLDSDIESYMEGANRIKSCSFYMEDELDGHMFVEYFEDRPGDYAMRSTYADPDEVGFSETKTYGEHGSFVIVDKEYFDEDDNLCDTPQWTGTIKETYDEHGNITEESSSEEYADGEKSTQSYVYTYTYDDNGNPTSVRVEFNDIRVDADGSSHVHNEEYMTRTYGEYIQIDCSGVKSPSAELVAGPAPVYNAMGQRVATVESESDLNNLPAGLYIMKGRKFIVK